MQRLINILLAFKEYVVLILLLVTSLTLLGLNDNTQLRAIRSYTVGFIGIVQGALSIVPNVFELKHENEVLRELNVNLSNEVNLLREARLENNKLRGMLGLKEHFTSALLAGDVVGKSLLLLRNTITINIGEQESVRVDMPIISESGLVGKVIVTSAHYCIGQVLFNKDFRASAKVERSRVDGIIAWDGGEYLKMKNVPKSQDVREGDAVITSEYSNIFPGRIKIGVVVKISDKVGSLFQDIDVKPTIDFSSLEQVFVVLRSLDPERTALEKKSVPSK